MKKIMTVIVIIAVLAGAIFGGSYLYNQYRLKQETLLQRNNLDGLSVEEIINMLDRESSFSNNLVASVRPHELLLTDDYGEQTLELGDMFYLSFAPYVSLTHECFYHSLTTCQGELVNESIQVKITDVAGNVRFNQTVTTYDNGFYGVWLERDIEATLTVIDKDRAGSVVITTDDDAPTCITTLKLHDGV